MKKLIKEFKERGIFEEHREYIKAWLSYLDQKEFSEKLEKQMLTEIKRYLSTRDKKILDYIVEVVWNATDTEAWIIVIKEQKN
jgi:predicted house-cleaning noncanonical NTP pyrophosphatase (MazG superfamily)